METNLKLISSFCPELWKIQFKGVDIFVDPIFHSCHIQKGKREKRFSIKDLDLNSFLHKLYSELQDQNGYDLIEGTEEKEEEPEHEYDMWDKADDLYEAYHEDLMKL